jgi:MFS family permease
VRQVFVDLSPFRQSRAFRRLWTGYVVNQVGSQLTVVAIAYQTYTLTGSSLDVGLISLAQLIPGFAAPLIAGAVADVLDRRNLLFVTNAGGLVCSLGLALDAQFAVHALWPLFVLAAGSAAFAGADNPIRTALMISVVPRQLITSANVLRSLLSQVATVVGPTAAGVLLQGGVSSVYWVDVGSFVAVLVTIGAVTSPARAATTGALGLRSFLDGIAFARSSQAILGCLIADLSVSVLAMPESLFPQIGLHQLHGDARTVGLLYAAPGAGALIMAVASGWTRHVGRAGLAIIVAIAAWGVLLTLFGLSHYLFLVLVILALCGAANAVSGVFRNTVVQTEAPDGLRARLASIHIAVVQAGPRLGNAEAGAVASVIGPQLALITGGLASIVAIVAIAARMPGFRRYRLDAATGAGEAPSSTQPPPGRL